MNNICLFLVQFLFVSSVYGQFDFKDWTGHFSYRNIKQLAHVEDKVYAVADNAFFVYDTKSGVSESISSINGLTGEYVSCVHYSQAMNCSVIGYVNGLVTVLDHATGVSTHLYGIVNKTTILSSRKKINDLEEFQGKVFLGTGFGITVLDLKNKQLGDTYFIGANGDLREVKQVAVIGGGIYAITTEAGLMKANVQNPFLINYSQWEVAQAGIWSQLIKVDDVPYIVDAASNIYQINANNTLLKVYTLLQTPTEIKYLRNKFVITGANATEILDKNFNVLYKIEATADRPAPFMSATIDDTSAYIGLQSNGVKKIPFSSLSKTIDITHSGPAVNTVFRFKRGLNDTFYALFGGYTSQYNPFTYCCGGPSRYGVSTYKDGVWSTVDFDKLLNTNAIVSMAVNVKKPQEIYFGSFFKGVLYTKNNNGEILYTPKNSSLTDDLIPNVALVNNLNFDSNGNLWMTNSRSFSPLHVLYPDGKWQGFALDGFSLNAKEDNHSSMIIDKNGTKWIGTLQSGVIAFNEKTNKTLSLNSDKGKLPFNDVRSLALDLNQQLWIGTFKGLRIVPNVNTFLTNNSLDTKSIIILENKVAQELFYQSNILDIAVDGSNSKWVAVEESGVFLISPDGQKTISHFTKQNSPLPSNTIIDIEINPVTGEVYFATDKGMVSYKSSTTYGTNTYADAYIYPNPYRPEHKDNIKITGLKDKSNVKITDVEGNLVFETLSQGGTVVWDTRSFSQKLVSSGVYLVLITDNEGQETTTKNVLIIR